MVQDSPGGLTTTGGQIYQTAAVTVTNGATFDLKGSTETFGSLHFGGAGVNGGGALINSSSFPAALTVSGTYSLVNDTTLGGIGQFTNSGNIVGSSALIMVGENVVTLTGTNSYTGNTSITAGTLAFSGTATLSGTPIISVGNGATFDVTGLSSLPFVLGSSQTLSNSVSSTGALNGSMDASSGAISVSYTAGTAALTVANGTLNLGAGTVVNVNNTGAQLAVGTYQLISSGTGGSVIGVAPTAVTVGGAGAAGPALLQINSGELDLVVTASAPPPANMTASMSGNQVVLNWPSGQGWQLQAQTNSLDTGLTPNWFNVAGATPPLTNNIDPANPSVYYRLSHP